MRERSVFELNWTVGAFATTKGALYKVEIPGTKLKAPLVSAGISIELAKGHCGSSGCDGTTSQGAVASLSLGPIGFDKDVRKIGNYHRDLLDQPYNGVQPSNLYDVLPDDKVFTFDYGFIVGVEGVINFSEIGRRVTSLLE